jgi:hypothetical protein
MYSFHKKLPEERTPAKPDLRPVIVGSVLTRFGCRVVVKINKIYVAEQLLLSHQFSFGVNGGVQQVILACTILLEINPTWMMLEMYSKNAHTFCNRDKLEEELELTVVYHYMLMSYKALYGKNVTVQWHFGNGPDNHPTSLQMSCEGLRQGDAPTSVYFNVLIARVYRKHIAMLARRGALFAVADDVEILAAPAVIAELAEGFRAMEWNKAGLKTQSVKNKLFVQPSTQAGWNIFSVFDPTQLLI